MTTMIQIRNVPEDVHRELKARAALEGVSMSELVLRAIRTTIERPTRGEILQRIAALPEVEVEPSPAAVIREEREAG